MKTSVECVPCLLNSWLRALRLHMPAGQIPDELMREALTIIAQSDFSQPSPRLARSLYSLIERNTGVFDPYRDTREYYNRAMLGMEDEFRSFLGDDECLNAGVRLVITGNVIDFAGGYSVSEDLVRKKIAQIPNQTLAIDDTIRLEEALDNATSLLVVGDNCGEIVFDKVFLELLAKKYPRISLTYAVRGGPILNDVTREDAYYVGIDKVARLVDTGDRAPGILLDLVSDEFREEFASADVVISKGQGNYESLNQVSRNNLFFLFVAKCRFVARHLGVDEFNLVCLEHRGSKTSRSSTSY